MLHVILSSTTIFWSGDIVELLKDLKQKDGKTIWLVGGSARTTGLELSSDSTHLPFGSRRQKALELRHQRTQILQLIRRCLKHNDSNGELRKGLLKGEVAVNRDEDIELILCTSEQITIL